MRKLLVVAALAASLLTGLLPTSSARFTDTTTADMNTFSFGTSQPIRATTYRVSFTGSYHTLRLNHPLAENYFVLLRGSSDVDGETDDVDEPIPATGSDDYVRVVGDPSGRPGRITDGTSIELGRFGSAGTWWGQVTVVESLDEHSTKGFILRNVHRAALSGSTWSAPGSWADRGQVGLYGGSMGGGMAVDGNEHAAGWARVWPEGGSVMIERGSDIHRANFTVYEVEWGSEWTIQSVRVEGDGGGPGVDTPSDYDHGTLQQEVFRRNSFILAYGFTAGSTPATGWEGQIYAFGNGHWVGSKDNKADNAQKVVAVGSHVPVQRDVQVYVHSHPSLSVDHRYGAHGSIAAEAGGGTVRVDPPSAPETYGYGTTGTLRFSIFSNSSTGASGPQPVAWSRHTYSQGVSWARNAVAEEGAFWLQSVDFGGIWN